MGELALDADGIELYGAAPGRPHDVETVACDRFGHGHGGQRKTAQTVRGPGAPAGGEPRKLVIIIMQKNSNKRRAGTGTTVAEFVFTHPSATAVGIAGTFNDWRPQVTPMVLVGQGRWMKRLSLPPGVYQYRIVADGEWMPDPLAAATTPNPLGGVNSILGVPLQSAGRTG